MKKFGMEFPGDSPNFGEMKIDKQNSCLFLLSADVPKLVNLVKRAVCVDTYSADKFTFDTGDLAYVIDSGRVFVYEASTDTWYEQGV